MGTLDKEGFKKDVETCSEVKLFFTIDGLGGFIWRMNHDLADGRIQSTPGIEEDLKNMQDASGIAFDQTSRFLKKHKDEDGKPSEEYRKWYKTWKDYIEGLPADEWRKLGRLLNEGGDVSAFRPAGL